MARRAAVWWVGIPPTQGARANVVGDGTLVELLSACSVLSGKGSEHSSESVLIQRFSRNFLRRLSLLTNKKIKLAIILQGCAWNRVGIKVVRKERSGINSEQWDTWCTAGLRSLQPGAGSSDRQQTRSTTPRPSARWHSSCEPEPTPAPQCSSSPVLPRCPRPHTKPAGAASRAPSPPLPRPPRRSWLRPTPSDPALLSYRAGRHSGPNHCRSEYGAGLSHSPSCWGVWKWRHRGCPLRAPAAAAGLAALAPVLSPFPPVSRWFRPVRPIATAAALREDGGSGLGAAAGSVIVARFFPSPRRACLTRKRRRARTASSSSWCWGTAPQGRSVPRLPLRLPRPLLGPAALRAHLRVRSALGGETLREVSVPSALLARLANERACAAVISFSWALINRAAQSCFPAASRATPAGNCAQGALGSTRSCRGALRAELSAYGAPAALCLTLGHSSGARKEPAADFGCGFFFSFSFCSQHKRCLGVVCEWKLYASVYTTA